MSIMDSIMRESWMGLKDPLLVDLAKPDPSRKPNPNSLGGFGF